LLLATCGTDSAPVSPDAPPGPFDIAPQCTSGTRWKMGDQRSALMYPGRACNECHESRIDTPRMHVAGTVYPTGHEPDNCNGAVGAIVEIVDANGATHSLETNTAGNFLILITEPLAFPIHARVVAGGQERVMVGAVTTGDCNSCHTQDGASSAPGRIVLP
jgi:hypothetical protein